MAQSITLDQQEKRVEQAGIRALAAGTLSSKMIAALIGAIVLFVACAVLIVWTHDTKVRLAYEISNASKELDVLREANLKLILKRNKKLHPDRLILLANEFKLEKPQMDQVITVYDEREYNKTR